MLEATAGGQKCSHLHPLITRCQASSQLPNAKPPTAQVPGKSLTLQIQESGILNLVTTFSGGDLDNLPATQWEELLFVSRKKAREWLWGEARLNNQGAPFQGN